MPDRTPYSLSGKTALVTGAGSGIGAAIAEMMASVGAYVFATDRDMATAQATAERIVNAGNRAEAMTLDVADEVACAQAAEAVTRSKGALDILVNNAGIGHVGTMMTTSGGDLDRLYQVNVRGMFNVCKAFLGGMIERKRGAIVNMASVAGVVGIKDRLAYATTKFAVVGLTKCMALDHATDGVRVNCICPGRVKTPFVAARLKEYADPERAYREMSATQAMGRMGTPEEIAAAAVYLASDEASFVTGSALMIDGGWVG
jgi:NAD(P)-dependent dehydrogenase (short-subunit alcohol dehydrogenase family)